MDVVNKIKGAETGMMAGHQDVPKETIVIEKAEISDLKPMAETLFISDLHLSAERPETVHRFLRFLALGVPGAGGALHPSVTYSMPGSPMTW